MSWRLCERGRRSNSVALIEFELPEIVGINTPTPLSVPYVLDLMRPALETAAAAS